MHTKCSKCGMSEDLPLGTENIKDTRFLIWVVLPILRKALFVSHPVKACNAGGTLQTSFPSACNFVTLMRCLLLPVPVSDRITCANYAWIEGGEWRHLCLGIWYGCVIFFMTGNLKVIKLFQSFGTFVRGPLIKCDLPTPLAALSKLFTDAIRVSYEIHSLCVHGFWGTGQRYLIVILQT